MSAPEVNVPLLRKAVEWAEAEAAKPRPLREWEQGFYVLPAADNDPQIADVADDNWMPSLDRARLGKAPECGTCYCIAGYVDAATNERPSAYGEIFDSARDALGLRDIDAATLFWGQNSIEDVRRIAEDIAGERL